MRVVKDFEIYEELGSGGYGKVFKARHKKSLEIFAIKLSDPNENASVKEAKILKQISGGVGVPTYYTSGKTSKEHYIVMELLGNSLHTELVNLGRAFSLGCILEIGVQLIDRLEYIHNQGIIHRDIKPSQLLLSSTREIINLVDFGLASYYTKKKVHKMLKTNLVPKGSAVFASIHCHIGFKQSRRDDLESLFYTLAYLGKGKLPWTVNCGDISRGKKWDFFLKHKLASNQLIFSDFPVEFLNMFQYIKRLRYEERPLYDLFRNNFKKISLNIKQANSFDWGLIGVKSEKITFVNRKPRLHRRRSLKNEIQFDSTKKNKKSKRSNDISTSLNRLTASVIVNTCDPSFLPLDDFNELMETEKGELPQFLHRNRKKSYSNKN